MSPLLIFFTIVITIALGAAIIAALNIKTPMLIAITILITGLIVFISIERLGKSAIIIATSAPDISVISVTPTPPVKLPANIDTHNIPPTEDENLPFDNLPPSELIARLNYIYSATAQPYSPTKHISDITSADKTLEGNGLLDFKSPQFIEYPQLTTNQINALDCTNYGELNTRTCIQAANQLNDAPIADCARKYNPPSDGLFEARMAASIVKIQEAFGSMEDTVVQPIYYNAPNEDGVAASCRTCKVGLCTHGICV